MRRVRDGVAGMTALTDLERRRVDAALAAWYAPAPAPALEPGDVEDMHAALQDPTVEDALIRWAYKGKPDGDLPADDMAAMGRARAAAAEVTA